MRGLLKKIRIGKIDQINRKYQEKMCKNCKFYNNYKCTKNRVAEDCARKGLKNR